MARKVDVFLLALLLWLVPLAAVAKKAESKSESEKLPTVAEKVRDLEAREGLLRLHLDAARGRVYLELPPPGDDGVIGRYLYVTALATGIGSNPVGLDRSQQGPTRLVRLRRVGGKVFLEEENLGFRALSENGAERESVRDSFAFSVLWGSDLAALDGDGRSLVDLSSFLTSDYHGIVRRLEESGQGTYEIDPERSAPDLRATLVFPDNVELEAVLTLRGKKPGRELRSTVPTAEVVSLALHHSFVRLPKEGYRPRAFDPRAASFGVTFLDYAAALDEPLEVRWISRHRLQKTDPSAASSPVLEPIVYYLDPGAPEPVRSALREGASWWAEAFAAAGFEDAFRVEDLPPGAHPLDVRYNVIQWVHRSTRGWSYGGGTIDPRTGEILKGHVLLGSLRVRQDRLLFEGLAGTSKTGTGAADDPVELALARIRQLAAHEVGHTLGFTHNFAASTFGGRASVMDYPAPLVRVTEDGELDFSEAYGVGVGSWDVHAVRYAYSEFPEGVDESEALAEIVREGQEAGLLFLTDADARPLGSAHPLAHLWDNGDDPAEALLQTLEVRRIALGHFGRDRLRPGMPQALLEEVLAPLYFHHRYQLEAAGKLVGGLDYDYSLVDDASAEVRPVDAAWQRRALAACLEVLDPEELDLGEETLALLLPRPFGYGSHPELFGGRTGPGFDAVEAAATATDQVASLLLESSRMARLVDQHRREPGQLGLDETLSALLSRVFEARELSPRREELVWGMQAAVVDRLLATASQEQPPRIAARLESALRTLARELGGSLSGGRGSHERLLAKKIERFLERGLVDAAPAGPPPAALPPGSPIGASLAGCSTSG